MDKKSKSAETEPFPLLNTRLKKVALLAYDQDEIGTSKARSAEFRSLSLRDFLYLVFKRKIQIFSFFVAVVLTVAVITFLTPPIYQSSAQILVKIGRQDLYAHDRATMKPADDKQINSEIEILKSRSLAEKTLLTLIPAVVYPKPDPQDTEVRTVLPIFQKALEVRNIKNSNLINVSFKHKDPDMSATVINTLTDIYLDHHLEVHKTSKTYGFFQEQTRFLKEKMQQSQQKLKVLKERHEVISLEEERSLALKGEAKLRADLNQTMSLEVETDKRIGQLSQQFAGTPNTISRGGVINQNQDLISRLGTRLVELQLKEKEYLAKYTNRNRLVKNVKAEIRMVQAKLDEFGKKRYGSKHSGANPTYQKLQEELFRYEADLKALKAKAEVQRAQLDNYQIKLYKLNDIEVELKQLQEEVDVDRETYRLYLTKFEESRISDEMDSEKIAGVSLIEAAQSPYEPINRKFKLNLLLAVALGAFGGLGLAFCLEYLGNSLETVEDVEECLQLPVLVSVPELKL